MNFLRDRVEQVLITEGEVRDALIGGGYGDSISAWKKEAVFVSSGHKLTASELREALLGISGNVSAAARLVKLPRSTFRSRLERLEQSKRG